MAGGGMEDTQSVVLLSAIYRCRSVRTLIYSHIIYYQHVANTSSDQVFNVPQNCCEPI
jgi:hypothetical protein